MICATLHRSISMRRTASWGSRDAFSDGHISRHADDPVVPQGRRILAATTKAHRHKHARPLVRSANYQAMHQQQPAELDGRRPSFSSSDNDSSMFQRPLPSQEAARRMSAPEHPPGKNQLTSSSCVSLFAPSMFASVCLVRTGIADNCRLHC